MLVHLSETRRDELFSTVEELRDELTPNAVHLLTIADWCHPNVYHGAKPSASEAFQQVARVCRTGDTTVITSEIMRPTTAFYQVPLVRFSIAFTGA